MYRRFDTHGLRVRYAKRGKDGRERNCKGLIKALGYKKNSYVRNDAARALVTIGESAVELQIT